MNSSRETHSEYQAFREKKHEQFNTPQEIISDAVFKATGSQILKQERIISGETNEVYFIDTSDEKRLVIRIYHGERFKFERERWALEQCASIGVPVPKVLLVERIEVESKPMEIMVESRLDGIGLRDLKKSDQDPENNKKLLSKLGTVLEKIHSIPTNGFGPLDKNGNGKYPSAKEMLLNDQYISDARILPRDESIPFDRETVRKAKKILNREAQNFPDIKPKLLHGDLAPQHILVDKDEISGIIDFETARGSDPAEEFARWELKFGNEYPISNIQNGYSNKELFDEDFEKRKNIWRLFQGLVQLSYCLREKKGFAIEKIVQNLKETIQKFEH